MVPKLYELKSPSQLKGLSINELTLLSEELRAPLMRKLAARGGHVGPNLGVVEATVALHYVFDAPQDRIVFDVSHQSYVHKMLTGRIDAFLDPAKYNDVSGYTNPDESPYDLFEIGHTSTSISLALGIAKARDLQHENYRVAAFIGDASLGGGQALEALNLAPTLGTNFTVILNDNEMSIAENHGELFTHLAQLRETNGNAANNIFKALGYEYIYVANGNDIAALIRAFEAAHKADHAVLVHIHTLKGAGLPVAEADKEKFHYSAPFDMHTGALVNPSPALTYTDIFARHMMEQMHSDPRVVTLTAGTPGAIGFTPDRRQAAGAQFVDTGICEQTAASMCAGLARAGSRPVFGVMATFIQRAYDQLSQDIAINDLPAVIVSFAGGVWGIPDATHLGFFDVALASNIPNFIFLSPANAEEYTAMLSWAVAQHDHPVYVRTPDGPVTHADYAVAPDFIRAQVIREGSDGIAIVGEGAFLALATEAAALLEKEDVSATVINPRCLSHVDTATYDKLRDYKCVITLDDGIVDGGYGQKIAAYFGDSPVKVHTLGLEKEFLDRYDASQVLEANGLTPRQIATLALSQR